MKEIRQGVSVQRSLLFYFLGFGCIPMAVIVFSYALYTGAALNRTFRDNRYNVMAGVSDHAITRIQDIEKVTEMVYTDSDIQKLLSSNGTPFNYFILKNGIDTVQRNISYLGSNRYVMSGVILGDNGLDLRFGPSAAFLSPDDIVGSDWYQSGMSSDLNIFWANETDYPYIVPYVTVDTSKMLPVMRKLYDINTGEKVGILVLFLLPNFFADLYGTGTGLETGMTVFSEQNEIIYSAISEFSSGVPLPSQQNIVWSGEEYLQTHITLPNGLTLMETVPVGYVHQQRIFLFISCIGIVALTAFASLFIARYLSNRVTRPIQTLLSGIEQISKGELDTPVQASGSKEVYQLGQHIEWMRIRVKELIQLAVQNESLLKRAELSALQMQINPHFIYNTLNTIKVMATMQRATSIATVTQKLGNILRINLANSDDKVTVREDLEQLEDYFYIVRARYNGNIDFFVEVKEENIYSFRILKFMLQPLIENAVFHGLELKGARGEIHINLCAKDDTLQIRVWDNGLGMNDKQLKQIESILSGIIPDVEQVREGDSTHLGIQNIQRRIQMFYGAEYGLSYQSKEGEYTSICMTLPMDKAKEV